MDYALEQNVGFLLRQVQQRHLAIFADLLPELTATQFATLAKLLEAGPCSQNRLGRLTAMDAATIKGVVDRLTVRGLTQSNPDPKDARMLVISLTPEGHAVITRAIPAAQEITRRTLAPLSDTEQRTLNRLLHRLT